MCLKTIAFIWMNNTNFNYSIKIKHFSSTFREEDIKSSKPHRDDIHASKNDLKVVPQNI